MSICFTTIFASSSVGIARYTRRSSGCGIDLRFSRWANQIELDILHLQCDFRLQTHRTKPVTILSSPGQRIAVPNINHLFYRQVITDRTKAGGICLFQAFGVPSPSASVMDDQDALNRIDMKADFCQSLSLKNGISIPPLTEHRHWKSASTMRVPINVSVFDRRISKVNTFYRHKLRTYH